ncbi:MAG: hypothetical protein AABZ60_08120 [Planctomycetota bacterium]
MIASLETQFRLLQNDEKTPLVFYLLAGTSLLLLGSLALMLYPGPMLGGDNMTHVMVLDRLRQQLQEGDLNIWHEQLECGSPGWLYYQPLGHFITTFIGLIVPLDTLIYYKIVVALMILLLPWIIFFSFRWMGLSQWASLIGAISYLSLNCFVPFGLGLATFYKKGLFTMLWGISFCFPAIACIFRTFFPVQGKEGSAVTAGCWLGLCFASHPSLGSIGATFALIVFLLAIGHHSSPPSPTLRLNFALLAGVSGLLSTLFALLQFTQKSFTYTQEVSPEIVPLGVFQIAQNSWIWGLVGALFTFISILALLLLKNADRGYWKKMFGKFAIIGILSNLIILPYSLPMALNSEHFGGFPMKEKMRLWGFPIEKFGIWFFQGDVLDFNLWSHFHWNTWLFCLFLLFLPKFRKDPYWQSTFFLWIVMMMYTTGFDSFGGLIYLNPTNFGVAHYRYVSGVQLSCLMAMSLVLGHFLKNVRPFMACLLLFCFVLLPFLGGVRLRLNPNEMTIHGYFLQQDLDPQGKKETLSDLKNYLNQHSPQGRVHNMFTADRAIAYFSNLYTKHPMARSWGVGGQDSLTTYYLDCDTYLWFRPEILELFAMEYVLGGFLPQWLGEGFHIEKFLSERWEPVDFGKGIVSPKNLKENDVALYRYKRSVALFSFIDIGAIFVGPSKSARPLISNWMKSSWLKQKSHVLMVRNAKNIPSELQSLPQIYSETKKPWEAIIADDYQFKQSPKNATWQFQWPNPQVVLSEGCIEKIQGERNTYSAEILTQQPAWVLFKMSCHAYWKASFEGQPLQVYQASPSFMAVKVPAGEGTLKFYYEYPLWAKLLWGCFFLWFFCWFFVITMRLKPKKQSPKNSSIQEIASVPSQ